MPSHAKHIVVALRMAGIAGQDKLSGIFAFLAEGHRWNLALYRTRHEFTAETVRNELARRADGFIVGIPEATDAFAALAQTDIPVILMNVDSKAVHERRTRRCAVVMSDATAVGKSAAHALLAQGVYKSYGYVGYHADASWSRERGVAFAAALGKAGHACAFFDRRHVGARIEDRDALADWLRALPKPGGILAACDDSAYKVLGVCRDAGITVPAEMGVLGVNNDPLLCENAEPPLSSIQPDFRREGYLAAELLDRMTANGRKIRAEARPILVGIREVVHRASTFPPSTAGILIQKALAFIGRNATRKLSVHDVANHLRISRSLLDLRFRELQHETVHTAILRARIESVKSRLKASRDTIKRIAADCGWQNVNALRNAFLRVTGQTMLAYRARFDRQSDNASRRNTLRPEASPQRKTEGQNGAPQS